MWQLEDMLRACNFDVDVLMRGFNLSPLEMPKVRQWYQDMAEAMKAEGIQKKGHLMQLKELEADWFQRDKSTISRHIKNIFSEGELFPDSVVANFATTAADKDFLDNIKSLPTK